MPLPNSWNVWSFVETSPVVELVLHWMYCQVREFTSHPTIEQLEPTWPNEAKAKKRHKSCRIVVITGLRQRVKAKERSTVASSERGCFCIGLYSCCGLELGPLHLLQEPNRKGDQGVDASFAARILLFLRVTKSRARTQNGTAPMRLSQEHFFVKLRRSSRNARGRMKATALHNPLRVAGSWFPCLPRDIIEPIRL